MICDGVLAENGYLQMNSGLNSIEHLPCFPGAQHEHGRFDLAQTHILLSATVPHFQNGLENSPWFEEKAMK